MSDYERVLPVWGRVTIESMRLALKAEYVAAEFSSAIRALLLLATAARVVFYARNQSLGFGIEPAEVSRSLVTVYLPRPVTAMGNPARVVRTVPGLSKAEDL